MKNAAVYEKKKALRQSAENNLFLEMINWKRNFGELPSNSLKKRNRVVRNILSILFLKEYVREELLCLKYRCWPKRFIFVLHLPTVVGIDNFLIVASKCNSCHLFYYFVWIIMPAVNLNNKRLVQVKPGNCIVLGKQRFLHFFWKIRERNSDEDDLDCARS